MDRTSIVILNAITSLLTGIGIVSCKEQTTIEETSRKKVEKPAWMSSDTNEWPQIVLTNKADFNGHSSLNGASGFLAQNSRGEIFYATAAHLLGVNGGVQPELTESKLDSVLVSWVAYPRTRNESTLLITGVAGTPSNDPDNDWALLKVEQSNTDLPAKPLRLRRKQVRIGETVHLIGVPYSEPNETQNVYSGVVTARGYGDRFRFNIDPPVDIRGFSGAPIVDESGLVVGVMTVWFDPKMNGSNFLEAGGEDAASIFKRIESAKP